MMLAVAVYFPAAFIRMTAHQRFNAGFEVRENVELIKRSPGNYFIAIAIYLVANFIAQFGDAPLLRAVSSRRRSGRSACRAWAWARWRGRDPDLGGPPGYAPWLA